MANRQSNLFQEVSTETIRTIFEHEMKESKIWETRLLDGGMFNTTYYVEYGPAHKKAVLRLGPVNRHLVAGFEENLMNAEVYTYSVCRKIGIPCSRVLGCDTSKEVIDRDFMIVEYIPSVAMVNLDLPEEKRQELYFQMGRYLAKLHQVNGDNASIFVNKELQRVTRGALDDLSDKGVIKKFPPCIASTHTALVLKEPKTKTSIRRVYLPKTVAKMLVDRKAEIDELKDLFGDEYIDNDLVFCTSNGRPMESQIINRAFNKLIKENGFPHVVFHSLRHSSITYKLKLNGGDMKAVQGDSGHAQMKMVADVYSHIIDEDRCINAQRFEDAF